MKDTRTEQTEIWTSQFGSEYTERNRFNNNEKEFNKVYIKRYGKTRDEICSDWLKSVPKNSKILEIGTNLGHQLKTLKRVGYSDLYGVEVQPEIVKEVRLNSPEFEILLSNAQNLPFKDNFFDLVFTNNVLIHISPKDINKVVSEICRVSKKWVWGFEYYAPEYTEIEYHGHNDLLWKTDFSSIFTKSCKGLSIIREEKIECLDEAGNIDQAYLLMQHS
jgi:pseudaminic acid biosynthesis-associated methylase